MDTSTLERWEGGGWDCVGVMSRLFSSVEFWQHRMGSLMNDSLIVFVVESVFD